MVGKKLFASSVHHLINIFKSKIGKWNSLETVKLHLFQSQIQLAQTHILSILEKLNQMKSKCLLMLLSHIRFFWRVMKSGISIEKKLIVLSKIAKSIIWQEIASLQHAIMRMNTANKEQITKLWSIKKKTPTLEMFGPSKTNLVVTETY